MCTKTWQPQRLSCPLCGQLDTSTYERWTDWQTGGPRYLPFPCHLMKPACIGGFADAWALPHELCKILGMMCSVRYPEVVVQRGGTGGDNSFVTESIAWQPHSAPHSYLIPPSPVRPPDAHFDKKAPPFTQAWWAVRTHTRLSYSTVCRDTLSLL